MQQVQSATGLVPWIILVTGMHEVQWTGLGSRGQASGSDLCNHPFDHLCDHPCNRPSDRPCDCQVEQVIECTGVRKPRAGVWI